MIEPGEEFSESDLDRIAELHVRSIHDSMPAMLGLRYARVFFRHLARSPHEWLFVERQGGRIESVCVVSLASESVYARTLRATLPALALHGLVALARSAAFRAFLLQFAVDLVRGSAGQPHSPEITYLFTNAELRSRGLGRRLVERAEEFLSARGSPTCYVRTLDASGNRALRFYDALRFQRIARQREGGRTFMVFAKPLALAAPQRRAG